MADSVFDSDDLAQGLFDKLTTDINVTLPVINWDQDYKFPYDNDSELLKPQSKLSNSDLTSGEVCGSGTIDLLVSKVRAILHDEYSQGRISQGEYSKTLIAMVEAAMANGTTFLIQRDNAYWQAVRNQIEATTARLAYATARLTYMATEAQLRTQLATYALTKLKLSTEDIGYGVAKYNLEQLLPTQKKLLTEQSEAARAQTMDNRSDGPTVTGTMGKQKALHQQQIDSYKRDAEIKAARPFIDAWITMKTVDEALLPPSGFQNSSLDTVLATIKTNNGLG